MPWVYHQRSGELTGPNGEHFSGYSGTPGAVNDPTQQHVPFRGPIPRGAYDVGMAINDPHMGPFAIQLSPRATTNTFGRAGFFIHGDNREANNSASQGCIIMHRNARTAIRNSGDTVLEVWE